MFRPLVNFFTLVIFGTLFLFSASGSEISKPISDELRTHITKIVTSLGEVSFELHYTPSDEEFMVKVEALLKRDVAPLIEYFQYAPTNAIHIMLNHTNVANGSATVFPWNIINLFSFPPIGNEHLVSIDNWLRGLVLHELVHILHMDQTRGVLKGLRTVFGSVGKLGGVTPRWFSEGLAVWAETHFTNSGRLRDPLLRLSLQELLNDPKYCQTLDCLDEPGVFPKGQLAYWMGGAFLDFLEREKAGTASCLVHANSDSLPFFLNDAFKECTGMRADQKFKQFRDSSKTGESSQREWVPTYQSRFLLTPKGIARYGITRRDPELMLGEDKKLKRPPGYVETFLPNTPMGEASDFSLVTLMGYQSGFAAREVWRFDLEKLEFVEQLKFPHDVESAFYLGDDNYLTLRYDSSRWLVETGSVNQREVIKEFEYLSHVRFPRVIKTEEGASLVYTLSSLGPEGEEYYSYQKLSIGSMTLETVMNSSMPIRVIGHCSDKVYLQGSEKSFEADFSKEGSILREIKGSPLLMDSMGQEVAYIVAGEAEIKRAGCEEFSRSLFGPLAKLEVRSFEKVSEDLSLASESYPSARHFLPQYWMFDYISADNLDAWKIYTRLSDPLHRHAFDLALDYYPEISKSASNFSYTYSRGYLRLLADYNKSYSRSSITRTQDTSQVYSGGIGLDRWWSNYNFALTAFYAKREVVDFISKRNIDEASLNLSLYRMGRFYDSFFGETSLQTRILRSSPEHLTNYWGAQARLMQSFHLIPRVKLHVLGTYGRLDKKDFRSGVIYGGGSSNYTTNYFHEFYGLAYSDAFGNEISTGRAQLDITAYNAYSGVASLFPFFLKELHLLAGMEFIHADRIFIEGESRGGFLIREDLRSYHAGLRILANIFYLVPIQSDLLYVNTENPFGDKDHDFLFLLRGNFSL